MQKFQRNYHCIFQIGHYEGLNQVIEQTIQIDYPITLYLNVERTNTPDANRGMFKFLNLSETHQSLLWKFEWEINKLIKMFLYAGYGDTTPLVFVGSVDQCSTYRISGSTEIVTEISATNMSELYRYGFVNQTISKDTKFKDLLNTLWGAVPDLKIGSISPDIESLKKDTAYIGQPMDLLSREYSKYQIFIDNDVLHVLGERDIIDSEHYVLTAASGMLGTPRIKGQVIEIDMLFEPGLTVGQSVLVLSDRLPQFNGTYKVLGIIHNGVISGRVSEKLTTKVTLIANSNLRRLKEDKGGYKGTKSDQWQKPVNDRVTSPFGWRVHPITKKRTFHSGIDYGSAKGTPILAAANGKVISTGYNIAGFSGYGNVVYIDNGMYENVKVTSLYAHLEDILVRPGQTVSKGEKIGLCGSTGQSTGPHLHFEIRENNTAVDPNKYI